METDIGVGGWLEEGTPRGKATTWGPRSESTVFSFLKSLCPLRTQIANILCLVGSFLFCLFRGIWEISAHVLTTQLLISWIIFILIQFVLLLELRETGRLISMASVCQWLS